MAADALVYRSGRIGICYFFAALLVMHTGWRTQALVGTTILFLFWAALLFVPVPGHGPGVLTPEGCLTTYVDQLLIPGKLGLGLYDRQGILSTFTAFATTLLGVLTGHWLRTGHSPRRKTMGLLAAGVAGLVLGHLWGKFFFLSRNIWTSSFVLYAGGWSLLLLALFYWIIDVKGYRKWAFFLIVIGMNSITIWVGQRASILATLPAFSSTASSHMRACSNPCWPPSRSCCSNGCSSISSTGTESISRRDRFLVPSCAPENGRHD